jgi:hypothetical protein
VQVGVPSSQYDPTRLLNIGTNRWSVKPRSASRRRSAAGRSKARQASPSTATTPTSSAARRAPQDPLIALQGHAIYSFASGIWTSLDVTYFTGGRSTIDGVLKNDLQQNWRARRDARLADRPPQLDQVRCEQRRVRRAPETISTCSRSRGSIAGAAGCERGSATSMTPRIAHSLDHPRETRHEEETVTGCLILIAMVLGIVIGYMIFVSYPTRRPRARSPATSRSSRTCSCASSR